MDLNEPKLNKAQPRLNRAHEEAQSTRLTKKQPEKQRYSFASWESSTRGAQGAQWQSFYCSTRLRVLTLLVRLKVAMELRLTMNTSSAPVRLSLLAFLGLLAFGFLLFVLSACSITTPNSLIDQTIMYNKATQQTQTAQLLLNIVRAVYNETPDQMAMAQLSVTQQTQSSISGLSLSGVPLSPFFNAAPISFSPGINTPSFNSGWGTTFVPLNSGPQLQAYLTPLALSAAASMVNTGYPLGRVLRIMTRNIGSYPNYIIGSLLPENGPPPFMKAVELFGVLENIYYQNNGAISVVDDGPDLAIVLPIPRHCHFTAREEQLLVNAGWIPSPKSIIVLSRNPANIGKPGYLHLVTYPILGIQNLLAQGIDFGPLGIEKDVPGFLHERLYKGIFEHDLLTAGFFKVYVAKYLPKNVYSAVSLHGYWFYVKNTDAVSKLTMEIIQILRELEQVGPASAPNLNINVNQ